MAIGYSLSIVIALLVTTNGVSSVEQADTQVKSANTQSADDSQDLKTAASNGYGADRYSSWGQYPGGYGGGGVTGYGSLEDRYYGTNGGYGGYSGNAGYGGYGGGAGYGGYSGYDGESRYGGYGGYGGYQPGYSTGYTGYGGNGGYGGYSGNGGLNSYYGYNNPSYQGGNHLGYGYYRRSGYGNIYNSGITPSLVTGYRGYSRK